MKRFAVNQMPFALTSRLSPGFTISVLYVVRLISIYSKPVTAFEDTVLSREISMEDLSTSFI